MIAQKARLAVVDRVTITRFLAGESGVPMLLGHGQSAAAQTDRQTQVGNPGDQPGIPLGWERATRRRLKAIGQECQARRLAHKHDASLIRWIQRPERGADFREATLHSRRPRFIVLCELGSLGCQQAAGALLASDESRLSTSFTIKGRPVGPSRQQHSKAPGWCRGWRQFRKQAPVAGGPGPQERIDGQTAPIRRAGQGKALSSPRQN